MLCYALGLSPLYTDVVTGAHLVAASQSLSHRPAPSICDASLCCATLRYAMRCAMRCYAMLCDALGSPRSVASASHRHADEVARAAHVKAIAAQRAAQRGRAASDAEQLEAEEAQAAQWRLDVAKRSARQHAAAAEEAAREAAEAAERAQRLTMGARKEKVLERKEERRASLRADALAAAAVVCSIAAQHGRAQHRA